jgi:phage shock protein C
MFEAKRLYRSREDRKLGGVCGGIAEYLNVDSTVIRILWILFAIAYGSGILAYLICWLIISEKPVLKPEGEMIYCTKCGTRNGRDAKFCVNCGAALLTVERG